jgi:hypothetical protein
MRAGSLATNNRVSGLNWQVYSSPERDMTAQSNEPLRIDIVSDVV